MQIYKLSDTQKMLAIGLMVVVAAVCMLLVQVPQSERGAHLWTTESIPLAQTAKPVPATGVAAPLLTQAKIEAAPTAASTQINAQDAQPAWQMAGVKAETPAIHLSEKISEFAIVQVDQNLAQLPRVGQQMQLPMLSGSALIANVESINTLSNGDRTWSGHLLGHGTDYPVVMTYGEHSIFATITTPQGSYTLESLDGLGWLYKNPAEIELSNPGAPDFLETPPQ